MGRVVVIGEVLLDLYPASRTASLVDAVALLPLQGGAPANVAVQLARLGTPVDMISAVGADPVGERLLQQLKIEGVGTRAIKTFAGRPTGMTMVELDESGERRFHSWRENSADLALSVDALPSALFDDALLVHRGSVSLRTESARAASQRALALGRERGALTSLDVNLCYGMFPSRTELLDGVRNLLRDAHIVKANLAEGHALFGEMEPPDLADAFHAAGVELLFLTLGAEGARASTRAGRKAFARPPPTRAVDTTGAGDAFLGAALHQLLLRNVGPNALSALTDEALLETASLGCWAASEVVTAVGATTKMPRSEGLASAQR